MPQDPSSQKCIDAQAAGTDPACFDNRSPELTPANVYAKSSIPKDRLVECSGPGINSETLCYGLRAGQAPAKASEALGLHWLSVTRYGICGCYMKNKWPFGPNKGINNMYVPPIEQKSDSYYG